MDAKHTLDNEHNNRIEELGKQLNDGIEPPLSDIFPNKTIQNSFNKSKVIIPFYDLREILFHYPFADHEYVLMCPNCSCVKDKSDLLSLLERKIIIPVLSSEYSKYPKDFINDLLLFPHISYHEYSFYRWMSLTSIGASVCNHCFDEKQKKFISVAERKIGQSIAHRFVNSCLSHLYPPIDDDLDLVDEFGLALENDDLESAFQIIEFSQSIHKIRTIQAFKARQLIPTAAMHSSRKLLKESSFKDLSKESEIIKDIIGKEFNINLPQEININNFLDIYEPFKGEIVKIVDSLIQESSIDENVSISRLSTILGDINTQISEIKNKPSYLFYRATISFLKANKGLVASSLLAGITGLTGNFLMCGASLATGFGTDIIIKKKGIKTTKELSNFLQEVRNRIHPPVQRILAKFINIDVRALQLYEFKENIKSKS